MRRQGRFWNAFLLGLVTFAVVYFYPLPYFISSPGEAVDLYPIIKVEKGYQEQGTFMLTTIRMGGANLISYVIAKSNLYMDIIPKDVILAHYRDEEEYTERQIQIMQSSKETAVAVAYEIANQKVDIINEGVMVVTTIENMPAEAHFQFGDMITHINDVRVETSEELIQTIQQKSIGEQVVIRYRRDDKEHEASIVLEALPLTEEEEDKKDENRNPRAGIGISTVTKRTVEVDPPVEINTSQIGGPSAGLMFALEIYNQLTEVDITKGYRIAGTGTISPNGEVGSIGGVHQKVVAADKAEADIFFVPHEAGALESNYRRALEAANDIDTEMKIVPVDKIHDALDYLKQLPHK